MTLTRDTTLAPGVYFLPRGIEIAADGVTLDGNGATLVGADFHGQGIRARGRSGLTLRNLRAERYFHGIVLEACPGARLIANTVTRTREIDANDVFLDIWRGRDDAYGAGILMVDCDDGVLEFNDLRHQQNGLLVYGGRRLRLSGNNASYNSGFGLGLFSSSDNWIENNTADFCCRVYQITREGALVERYHNGADAAALVMMGDCCRNHVKGNRLRGGGDGLFLGGFHKDLIRMPCNDNVFENNDGSWSPNIAFEATFSARNVFRGNRADACNYGFWLGYSSETTVVDNVIRDNRIAGVAIEHGHDNVIERNTFERNRAGASFWVNARPAFLTHFPECAESTRTTVQRNRFEDNGTAVKVWTEGEPDRPRCRDFVVRDNVLRGNAADVVLEGVRDAVVERNS